MAGPPRKVDCNTCGMSTPVYQLSKKGVCVYCTVFGGPERFLSEPETREEEE